MNTISNIHTLKQELKSKSGSIGFVPTMGALHEGHISLIKQAREENDIVVVSIFVNPTQFLAGEDLDKYPSKMLADEKICDLAGVDFLFTPDINTMYTQDEVLIKAPILRSYTLEGERRPGHFDGVLQVVCKLFNIVNPTNAYFGKKDAQQLSLIKQMVENLYMDINIIECEIIREVDGLAMLYRMYLRWAERKGFKIELLDHQSGDEAGIKDVSFIVSGINSYGYLKTENGIHRLVRISPFDSNSKRHTSFASVMVSPEVDDNIDIEIEDKDIRIDTYRASGAGGQHVNKTESAIRITHIETNVVVQCQNDRSQHKNKASAMKMLKSRLYELELEKQAAEKQGISKSEIGWGHQIRSYVMQPYQQVKDTRSNIGYSNIDGILDGDLDKMIEDVLISQSK